MYYESMRAEDSGYQF